MIQLVVTVEGGIIQEILSTHPGIEVITVDFDIETNADEDLLEHDPTDGRECIISRMTPTVDTKTIIRYQLLGRRTNLT
jgi:hypothetical protein